MISISDCRIIKLKKIEFSAGNITPIHELDDIPFKIKRVFYLYDIPGGQNRGGHSHKECHQFLIAGSGSFDVTVDDGKENEVHNMNRPYYGLYVPPGIWASETNFSSGSICLVLNSHYFNEEDYIRDYREYLSSHE
ncbi:MAG: hypothetical protein CMF54_07725 [Legionellales bacterium]|nr:hypothetical protein [Legionellales bacterium]|tara:strand:- start:1151 stop:1558 length:408 start_codon:yes stop_codon:yes gene_type:complete